MNGAQQHSAAGDRLPCVDIGANLTHKSFARDVERVIRSAEEEGVAAIVVTGASVESSRQAAQLAGGRPRLFSTAGVHPHDASSFDDETPAQLEQLAALPQVVAAGECGLDFNRDFSPRDRQRSCFEAQLRLAARLGLPLFLHERDAHEAFLEILRPLRDSLGAAVVHCFTGSAAEARAYLDLDLHIGVTGWICDERRGQHLREVVRDVPARRLMIETDAPYLAPRDLRPKVHRNEPRHLPHILRTVAACRGEPPEQLAPRLLRTTADFFQLPL